MGSRAGLDGCGKSHPSTEFEPRTVQSVAVYPERLAIFFSSSASSSTPQCVMTTAGL